jgi:hypothetical protein
MLLSAGIDLGVGARELARLLAQLALPFRQ